MNIFLTGYSALEFWRSRLACELAGAPVPFYEADVDERPPLALPAKLPRAALFSLDLTSESSVASYARPERYAPELTHSDREKLAALGLSDFLELAVFNENDRRRITESRQSIYQRTLPKDSFIRICDGLHVASPEFCFLEYARYNSIPDTALLGFELCGYYSLHHADKASARKALTTKPKLAAFLQKCHGLPGIEKALAAVTLFANGSDSPMESIVAATFTFPFKFGGLGQTPYYLNKNIVLPANDYRPCDQPRTCDLLFPHAQIEIEYNDKENHIKKRQQTKDARRFDEMAESGLICKQLTLERLQNINEMEHIAKEIAKRSGKRFQPRCPNYRERQIALFSKLVPGFSYQNRFREM